MRLAVISDIHGNYKALEAFINYIEQLKAAGEGVDQILLLGDYFADGPNPQLVMRMLKDLEKQYPCHFVLGNREEYLMDNRKKPQGWKVSSPNGMLYFVDRRLNEEILEFMNNLPMTQRLTFEEGEDILICHGSPTDTRGNFMEDPGLLAQCMKTLECNYLVGGHSHRQEVSRVYNKTYVNPGALGLAIDGVGKHAPFAIAESDAKGQWQTELFSIPYDVEGYLNDMEKSGLLEAGCVLARATRKTLLTGINYFFKVIIEVRRRTGLPTYSVPESVWEEVAEDFNL